MVSTPSKPQQEETTTGNGGGHQASDKSNRGSDTESAPSNRFRSCLKSFWGQVTILISLAGLFVSIYLPLTLGRQNWGGEFCRTNEGCKSERCDLASNLCFCTDGNGETYCRNPSYKCIENFDCEAAPTAAPTCASSVEIKEVNNVLAIDATTDANFGWSISIDGSTAVVGAYMDDSAYVFEGSGSDWAQSIKLTDSDASSENFGTSVAIDGETVVVGARGSAHVFQKSGSNGWDFLTKLEADKVSPGDKFGMAVALDGNTIVIGAKGDGQTDRGFASIFVQSGSDWVFQGNVPRVDGSDGDEFGRSIALHSDSAIVGSKTATYVYSRTGSDWKLKKKLTPKDAPAEYNSGYNVALNEDTAVIGALGSAYIFTVRGSEWAERQNISVDVSTSLPIPTSVALDGNTLILGSGGNDQLSAYTYVRVGLFEWEEAAVLKAPSGVSTEDQFGYSVAVSESDNVVMIGAPGLPGKQGSFYPLDFSACV